MLKSKKYDRIIKLIALILGVIFSLAVIFSFNRTLQAPEQKSETEKYYTEVKTEYDPSNKLEYVPDKGTDTVSPAYDPEYEKQKFILCTDATKKGYSLTNEDFNSDNSILARVAPASSFINSFSERSEKKLVLAHEEDPKGGNYYYQTQEEAQTPLLTSYYGYIIYTDSKSKKLLNSKLNTLVEDFSGYEPVYSETLSGNPLFIKDGLYYFYYDGNNYNGVVYEKIDEKTFSTLTKNPPAGAYDYFSYDYDLLRNILAGADTDTRTLENVVLTLKGGKGMVQYFPSADETGKKRIIRRTDNKSDYSSELIPFCCHTYNNTPIDEWWDPDAKPKTEMSEDGYYYGYMDRSGNVVIEPQYETAYPFSPAGTALIEDNGRLMFIDTSGRVVYDPYKTRIELPGITTSYLHNGYYPLGVYSVDTVGMYYFDLGYTMVRRKITDSANGNKVKTDENILISQFLETPNYPKDYSLIAYSDGIMLLEKGGYYGYMDTAGSWIVKPGLVYAEPFCEGLAVCGYEQGKLGMIDRKANTILAFCHTHIEGPSGGMVTAYAPELGWNVFAKMSTVKQTPTTPDIRIEIIKRKLAQAKAEDSELNKASKKTK